MEWTLAIVAAALLGVAAVSRRLSGTSLTPAMVLVAVGLVVGTEVLDLIDVPAGQPTVRVLAEATLALVLFTDASRIDLRQLGRRVGVPLRLLGVGLPLSIVLGTLVAAALFDQLTLGEALILGVILAPTDAALGQAVVSSPRIPARIGQGLNVESGLNDGICVPLLFAAVAAADIESHIDEGRGAAQLLAEEIGYGVLGGVAAGALIAAIVIQAGRRDLISGPWKQVIPAAGAALAYGIAVAARRLRVHRRLRRRGRLPRPARPRPREENRFSEEVGDVLSGVTFLLFGAILFGPALGALDWEVVLYAMLSLAVVRMAAVALAMLGSGARPRTVGFLGWFGPRGLASIVFALIVIEESQLPQQSLIVVAVYLTVGLSIFAHGLSAAPLASRYASWYEAHPRGREPPMESVATAVTRLRSRLGTQMERG